MMENKTLDCTWCGKTLPVNEMYSSDACSESCQDAILRNQKIKNLLQNIKKGTDILSNMLEGEQ